MHFWDDSPVLLLCRRMEGDLIGRCWVKWVWGWGIWFNPPELDFQETLHVCGGDSSIGWGVLYALCNRSTISKSVQTRFLKLLGMLSTSCKYRYQNIIHIKKHSTLKNLVLEILVLYTKFNILLSLQNIFVRWYRANKNNPINCINCII